jgi:glycogen operon protein
LKLETDIGRPIPLGASSRDGGVNFAVFSENATTITLELFDSPEAPIPTVSLKLEPSTHRTGDIWHIWVAGIEDGQLYGYRADGPYQPSEGHRFDRNKPLMDPYARAIAGHYDTESPQKTDNSSQSKTTLEKRDSSGSPAEAPKSVVWNQAFDWQGVTAPQTPLSETLIYEVHVRGLTIHPSSPASSKGTYRGVLDCIPHLKSLGVTAIELLPIQEFNTSEHARCNPQTGEQLHNYWGYSTAGFFGPVRRYAEGTKPGDAIVEFKTMVRELHRAGIEVILDVVYNHTAEGSELGPTWSFRGLDNKVYYALDSAGNYQNYSGCGNAINCNHPAVRQLILDSLHYWAVDMGVDGFRFDLATILGRDQSGAWINAGRSLLTDISSDPVLRGKKLISESWDAQGLYKVGQFPDGWLEWNGRFRDDIRRFLRGDHGLVRDVALRLGGSPDVFGRHKHPTNSVNFITCHDGFTLRDLNSYEQKHNEANGEQNRDGSNDNHSCNYGTEGETESVLINTMRLRQAKNAIALLMLSRGVPMLLGGDELWRTKGGNNNTYNQDNVLSWFDWTSSPDKREIQKFSEGIVALRNELAGLQRNRFADPAHPDPEDLVWHGIQLSAPDFTHHSQSLAFQVIPTCDEKNEQGIYVAINMWTDALTFELPQTGDWSCVLDTARPLGNDVVPVEQAFGPFSRTYDVQGRSIVMLIQE